MRMTDQPESAAMIPDGSIRDALTGAYSRASLQDRLREEVERSQRYDIPFSLCLFELDYFKSVNDAYGHIRGDEVLRELVRRLLSIMRDSDLLFRYGGEAARRRGYAVLATTGGWTHMQTP
jgi:diguanylate cyclase (GGDEF)-like protein